MIISSSVGSSRIIITFCTYVQEYSVHSERSQSHQCVITVFWRRLARPRRTWEDLGAPMRAGLFCAPSLPCLSLFLRLPASVTVVRARASKREKRGREYPKPKTEEVSKRPKRYSCAAQGLPRPPPPPLAVSQQRCPVSNRHCHQPCLLWPANQRP